jgi:hypothetical protein
VSCSGDSISRLACNRHPIQAPSPGHDKGDLANAPPPPNDRHKILSSRITVWHALCAEISRAINLSSSSSFPLLSFFPISWISCEHLRAHGRCTVLGNSGKLVTLETLSLTRFSKHVFQEQGIHDSRKPGTCGAVNSRMCKVRES